MAQLLSFRLQIELVELIWWHYNGYPFGHLDSMKLQILQLVRIVRQKLDRFHMERHQHVGGDIVVTLIRLEAQLFVRLNGVEPCILELVSSDLVDETDSATFLS